MPGREEFTLQGARERVLVLSLVRSWLLKALLEVVGLSFPFNLLTTHRKFRSRMFWRKEGAESSWGQDSANFDSATRAFKKIDKDMKNTS
jgi:hypothetical protein